MTTRKQKKPKISTAVEMTFVTSGLHRVIHADGIWGGLTPTGQIRMGIFSESTKDPYSVIYDVSGAKPREISRNPKPGLELSQVTRLMETDIIMHLNVAESVYEWLGVQIENLKTAIKTVEEMRVPEKGERPK